MYDFAMVGDDAFDVMHDEQDVCCGERMLADAMIALAIRDINKPKHRDQALRWVSDTTATYVSSFRACCEITGRDADTLRSLINRYAESGRDIECYSVKTKKRRQRRSGPKKTNVCAMQGCEAMTAGRMCSRCANVFYGRRYRHPHRPEVWYLPVLPPGGSRKIDDAFELVNQWT